MINQHHADITFLALTVWREARGENDETRAGIAHVILNRVKRPSWWGNDVMSVVFKKWQFSSLTDPNDRQLTTWPTTSDPSWRGCLTTAAAVLDGTLRNPVAGADHYYDISIKPPKWAYPKAFVTQIGRVLFFDLDRDTEV